MNVAVDQVGGALVVLGVAWALALYLLGQPTWQMLLAGVVASVGLVLAAAPEGAS